MMAAREGSIMTTITPAEVAAMRERGDTHALLDLRERGAYERGHIFRATALPRRLLEFRLPGLVTGRTTTLILCDGDETISRLAAPTLAAMGYTDVRILEDGLASWLAAGRPVVQGLNVESKVFGEQMLHANKTPQIAPHDLKQRIDAGEDLVIVDSRTPEEYHRGCIPGSVSMPGGELALRIAELVTSPEQTIVVHCGGRTRSYIGAESVRRLGLPNPVIALENGTMGWQLAGLELERGAARWAPPISERGRALAEPLAARVATDEAIAFVEPAELGGLWNRRHAENLNILDVRTADEYAAGHVAGAVWAPGGQTVQATDEYVAVRTARIVLVCDTTSRSVMTASWLRRMGYPNVAVLRGGISAWTAAGGAVERGHPTAVPAGLDAARGAVATVTAPALDAERRGARPPLVLHVDQSDAYARAHVPGAAWLCRSRLELRIHAVAPDRGAPIVVTCDDGAASTLAAATLAGLGYSAVRVLEGGMRAWAAAGLAVEQGATRLADEADDVVLKPYERGRRAMEDYLRWEELLDDQGQSPHPLLASHGA
jgi:rhodanese-related sulfurtransferase